MARLDFGAIILVFIYILNSVPTAVPYSKSIEARAFQYAQIRANPIIPNIIDKRTYSIHILIMYII